MKKEAISNKSIETIIKESESLQQEIDRLKQENKKLKVSLDKQQEATKASKDTKYAQAIIEERDSLKNENATLNKRLETATDIIDRMRRCLSEIKKNTTPGFEKQHIIELSKLGQSIFSIQQLVGLPKRQIMAILAEEAGEQTKREDKQEIIEIIKGQ